MLDVLAQGVLRFFVRGKELAANPIALTILAMTSSQISKALH